MLRLIDHPQVMPEPMSGCWIWTGMRTNKGYARTTGQPYFMVHRLSFESARGPIPEHLQLDHLCRLRCCVNPTHLEAVTSRINTLRGDGIAARNLRKTHCLRGHPFTEENTVYRLDRQARACRICREGSRHRNLHGNSREITMSYEMERENFLLAMQAEGMPPEIARRILRHANTYQRQAINECNGDGPSRLKDDGARKNANVLWAREQQARAERLTAQWCDKAGLAWEAADPLHRSVITIPFSPIFQGDPRGACVKLKVPSGKTDDWGREGICVPTRRY